MNKNTLLSTTDNDGICTLTLNRPEVHNAFDEQLIELLINTLIAIEQDDAVRVVVLKGNGKSFSAGADLRWMQKMVDYDKDENINDALQLAKLMGELNGLNKPTIAVVQGAAIGGGVGLVACCDIALASPKAFFCFSEVKLGLIPAVISPYVIAAIGERSARRYFLTAERIDAPTALQIGLIHEICEADDLEKKAIALAQQLINNEKNAISESKRLIQDVAGQPLNEALIQETAQRIANIRISSAAQQRLKAFLK